VEYNHSGHDPVPPLEKVNPMPTPRSPKVAVLLCAYNGEKFLSKQMDSFLAQSHENWELWIADDGSTDATLDIIDLYRGRGRAITVLGGPRKGASFNFLNLLRAPGLDADYFAWSDQDDVWLQDKLSRAVTTLENAGFGSGERSAPPAVYAGRTELIDAEERHIAFSPLFRKKPGFANALCQNIGGGNTMVFNRAARNLLSEGDVPKVVAHDWWAYMLVTGAGGSMLYDPEPTLRYRQHGGNLVG
jgi:glycosyltransferase involved in cell wall biosynthesis